MNDYLRLKALAIEADRRGDRATASAAMGKMRKLKDVYDAYGVDTSEEALSPDIKAAGEQAALDSVAENPWTSRAASFQAGARDLGRNLANMVLPERLGKALGVGDEEIRRKREEARPATEFAPGYETAGQIIPTLITAGVGTGGSLLGRAIAANPLKTAMLSGGVLGAATAGPDNRTEGAVLGSAAAGVGGKILQKAGQAVSTGLAPMSEKFKRYVTQQKLLNPDFDDFAPLQTAGPREGRGTGFMRLYDEVIGQTPWSRTALDAQRNAFKGEALKNPLRAAYGANTSAVLDDLMPGGKYTEVGGVNNLADALKKGDRLYKEQFDAAVLPGARQAFSAAKADVGQVEQSVQSGLQKTMARLTKSQQKLQDVQTQLKALGPAAQQADAAAEAAQPAFQQAKVLVKAAKEQARATADVAAKKVAEAQSAAARAGESPLSTKQAAAALRRADAAQKAAQQADDALKVAEKALKDARKVAQTASKVSQEKIAEEAALLAQQKTAERGLKAASTRMGNVQTAAEANVAAARQAAAQQGRALHAAQLDPGIPAAVKPYQEALTTAAARTRTGTPTFQQIATAADETTPQGAVLRKAMLGAQDLAAETAQRTTVAGRTLLAKTMNIAGGLVAPITRVAASKGFQSFLLGNTRWQNAINSAYSSGQGAGARIAIGQAIRAYLATGAGDLTADAKKELRVALDNLEDET